MKGSALEDRFEVAIRGEMRRQFDKTKIYGPVPHHDLGIVPMLPGAREIVIDSLGTQYHKAHFERSGDFVSLSAATT